MKYGDSNGHFIKKHKQFPGLLYEVKTSLHASIECNLKGSFTGEVVQHDPDQQHCSVSGSLIFGNTSTYCLVFFHVQCSG